MSGRSNPGAVARSRALILTRGARHGSQPCVCAGRGGAPGRAEGVTLRRTEADGPPAQVATGGVSCADVQLVEGAAGAVGGGAAAAATIAAASAPPKAPAPQPATVAPALPAAVPPQSTTEAAAPPPTEAAAPPTEAAAPPPTEVGAPPPTTEAASMTPVAAVAAASAVAGAGAGAAGAAAVDGTPAAQPQPTELTAVVRVGASGGFGIGLMRDKVGVKIRAVATTDGPADDRGKLAAGDVVKKIGEVHLMPGSTLADVKQLLGDGRREFVLTVERPVA